MQEEQERVANFKVGWLARMRGEPSSVLSGYDQCAGFESFSATGDIEGAADWHVRGTALLQSKELAADENGDVLWA
jgi:hypothetical protein